MIVFNLHCKDDHRFEGWFGSAREFASQKKRGLLSCPTCGDTGIERGLSAPRLNMGASQTYSALRLSHIALRRTAQGQIEQ